MQTIRTLALALAAVAALASCDSGPPTGAELLPPDGAVLATAPFPAPASFAAHRPLPGRRGVRLTWDDVPGDEGYLVQFRDGENGTWKSLVSTGANRTTYDTDSISNEFASYYRIAVFTADFRAGAFSTLLLKPFAYTETGTVTSDTTATLSGTIHYHGTDGTSFFEWGTDSLLAGAARTPDQAYNTSGGGFVSRTIPVVPGNVYYFRLNATNAGGTDQGEIRRFTAGPPAAPAGFTAVFSLAPRFTGTYDTSGAHNVLVEWTHSGERVARFLVQRRLVGAAAWIQVAEKSAGDTRRHLDQGFPVSSDREYDYRVLACNGIGLCSSSPEVRVSTRGLAPPAGFTASRAADGRVVLAWQDLPSEQSFVVQWRAGDTGSWQQLVSTGAGVKSYTTDRVTAGVTNHYRVAGEVMSFRAGAFSEASVAAGAGRSLQVQTGGHAVPSSTSATVSGTVTPNGLAAAAWIEWGTDPGLAGAAQTPSEPLGAGVSPRAFTDTLVVTPGQTYYYRAAASNSLGTVRGAIQSFQSGGPAAPATTAAFDLPNYRVVVSWTHSGQGTPTRFLVERRTTGQTAWTQVGDVHVSQPRTYLDVSFPANAARAYDYRVRACNAASECAPSNVAQAQTQPLAPPAGLTAAPASNGRVALTWQAVTGAPRYVVQWRTDPSAPWRHAASTGLSPQYTGTAVTPGKTNYYRVAGEASGYRYGLFSEVSIAVP